MCKPVKDTYKINREAIPAPVAGIDFDPETQRVDEMRCDVCGGFLIVPAVRGKGRPVTRHTDCAELRRRLNWLNEALEDWTKGKSKPQKNLLRQELLSMLNHHLNPSSK